MSYGPAMFCCTTLRDVIFVDWYFVNVISTTGILHHEVVCKVTTEMERKESEPATISFQMRVLR
jgi:hypothetical protein